MNTPQLPGIPELFIILMVVGVVVWPFWRIFSRLGLPGPIALLMLLPFVNVLVIFFVAFTKWPIEARLQPPDLPSRQV